MSINYMSMKNEELEALITEHGLEADDYKQENGSINRKKLNNVLKAIDLAVGKIKETQVSAPGEETKDYDPAGKKLHKGLSGMMVQLTFYNNDENDLPYIQMALNGTALNVPRENKVWIPKEFIDGVLVNAITTRMKMDVDRDGKIRYIPKKVPRVQYTVHDMKHIDVLRKEFDEERKNNNN